MQAWGAFLASSTLVVVGGAVGAVAQMGLVVFTMFYLFRDGERLRAAVYEMLPLERVQTHSITLRTRDVIAATLYGVLVISADPGHARHVHLLGAGAAVAAALGRRDVLSLDDPDGRVVSRLGAGGDLPGADRRLRQGRRSSCLGDRS